MAMRKGADVVIETLLKEGVDVIFGIPGGANMEIYDALYRINKIKHILARHEQGAGHMAEGYAKASGKVGVALATSGPGATNLITAIADAYMDSVPVVFLTGQVPTFLIGNDAFQEVDIVGMTRPVTKHNFLVKRVEDLPLIIRQAFYIARTGRPGPVLVDIPKDITQTMTDVEIPSDEEVINSLPGYKPHIEEILSK
jgi:acetolactate synthase, large subunit (EC 2.2.1.6)